MRNSFKWWFILLLAAATACTKKADVPPTEYTIPKEAADYLMMPANGYFIYRDSASGQLDSVEVETCRIEPMTQYPHTVWMGSPLLGYEKTIDGYPYQKYLLSLRSHNTGIIWLDGYSNDPWYESGPTNSQVRLEVSAIIKLADTLVTGTKIFEYPLDPGSAARRGNYQVEGVLYQDVIVATGWESLFYWAKGTGIIKWSCVFNGKKVAYTLVRKGRV